MQQFVSWKIAQKANNWTGRNVVRWANAEYDQLRQQARTALDPVTRAALFIRLNDLVIEDVVVIPTVLRHDVSAVSHSLRGLELGPWGLESLESGVLVPRDLRTPAVVQAVSTYSGREAT